MSDESLWTPQYYQKVLQVPGLIGYWMQDERQGTVAWDQVTLHGAAASRAGAYTGVTLGQPGIGDGRGTPWYDSANDCTAVSSASLIAAFNGAEGSLLVWARANSAAVWTDAAYRGVARFEVNANNYVQLRKSNANNQFQFLYAAGGTAKSVTHLTMTTADWFCAAITWSATADQMKAYMNGVQYGATQNGLGVWAGNIVASTTVLGALTTTPTLVWHGWVAHAMLFNRALSATTIAMLYSV